MKGLKLLCLLSVLSLGLTPVYSLDAFPPNYEKKRVLIATDIGLGIGGGDPDDAQSMIHFLAYSNMFDLEGIVVGRPKGDIRMMRDIIKAYKRDYPKFKFVSPDYPTPEYLKSITVKGAPRGSKTPSKGYSTPTAGSNLIVKAARRKDPRPLYIMAWGSVTDVAQAIHQAPDIKKNILLYAGGTKGFNYEWDPSPTDFLRKQQNHDLRWLDANGAGSGMFCTGTIKPLRKYGNIGFVNKVVKRRGALGKLYLRESCKITDINRCGIKMSDTVQLFFVMNGSFDTPKQESWGGSYCKIGKNRFAECPGARMCGREGAAVVSKYRKQFLKDWENRLIAIYDHNVLISD